MLLMSGQLSKEYGLVNGKIPKARQQMTRYGLDHVTSWAPWVACHRPTHFASAAELFAVLGS